MKKVLAYLFVIVAMLIAALFIYWNRQNFIEENTWKYGEGYHVTDWLEFNTRAEYTLVDRKIFKKGKLIGKIKICLGKYLIIKDTSGKETGFYFRK